MNDKRDRPYTFYSGDLDGMAFQIGYQPLMRCHHQSGYIMPMMRGKCLQEDSRFEKMRFLQSEELSNQVFEMMDNGKKVFPNEECGAGVKECILAIREETIRGIVLAGRSAFGLGAADGVMQYLEERDIGFDVGPLKVPLVCHCQADLFDLTVGDPGTRPDRDMGYEACANAQKGNYRDGNYGAGCGATVGKIASMDFCMKSGIGSYAIQLGGLLDEDKKSFRRTEDVMYASTEVVENKFTGNTTIGIIVTNGCFEKTALCKIAGMAHDGYARSIRPVHTRAERQYL